MPVVWYLYIFFICQLFVYLEAKMSTNWHFWRLLKMQTNSCIFVNKHHKNFLLGYFFIPYVYLNFDRKKNLEVHGMSRYLRHLQLTRKIKKWKIDAQSCTCDMLLPNIPWTFWHITFENRFNGDWGQSIFLNGHHGNKNCKNGEFLWPQKGQRPILMLPWRLVEWI